MQLQELLGEELYKQVEAKLNEANEKIEDKTKQIKFADLSEGNYVGKGKYDQVEQERDTLNEQIKALTSTIETLKKDNKDNEDLQTKISALETELVTQRENAKKQQLNYALIRAIQNEGCTDAEYLLYKVGGVDSFVFDNDGTPLNVSSVLKPFKENATTAHLFKTANGGYNPKSGTTVSEDNPFAKATLNLTKQGELWKNDPVRARELAKQAGLNY